MAFHHVLGKKQSKFGDMISWLDTIIEKTKAKSVRERMKMLRVVSEGNKAFENCEY